MSQADLGLGGRRAVAINSGNAQGLREKVSVDTEVQLVYFVIYVCEINQTVTA